MKLTEPIRRGYGFASIRAMDGNVEAGFIDYHESDEGALIDQLWVEHKYRRQGVATQLVEAVLKRYPSTTRVGFRTRDGLKLFENFSGRVRTPPW